MKKKGKKGRSHPLECDCEACKKERGSKDNNAREKPKRSLYYMLFKGGL